MATTSLKGPSYATEQFDASNQRVLIVHARWNAKIIEPLVQGAKKTILSKGVKEENVVVQSVPGSFELPFAVSRLIAASQVHAPTTGAGSVDLLGEPSNPSAQQSTNNPLDPLTPSSHTSGPFTSVIAIGVLIKGSTMHFEYICDSVTHQLMKIQLDTGVPVIFGVLTCLTEEQALERAGVAGEKGDRGHNHGVDWGEAAVEMGGKTLKWSTGVI